jgi:hypothetical protein
VTASDYQFVTTWRIAATPAEISAVLGDAVELARWWPSVYLRVSANHHWAMARGATSLRLELARRRARGDRLLASAIQRPPGPTFPHNIRARRRAEPPA